MARSQKVADIDNYNGTEVPGYYQRTSLDEIINNFIVGYTGDDKVLPSVPRHEVAFWAQRTVQEFSYDILHSENSIEIELGPAKTMLLPPDYVNLVRITKNDENGNTVTLKAAASTKVAKSALQDNNYDYVYDQDGEQVFTQESEAIKRFRTTRYDESRRAIDYYNGFYYNDDFTYYNQKRFGAQTTLANQESTYLLDNSTGIIYFDQDFATNDVVTLFYISDGLADNGDLSNVRVPKMAEDAIYASILYNLSKLRPSAAGAAALYKQEAKAKMRNTKIRLMNLRPEEMIDVMRGKSKWIKH